jgi:hypothetical protein
MHGRKIVLWPRLRLARHIKLKDRALSVAISSVGSLLKRGHRDCGKRRQIA